MLSVTQLWLRRGWAVLTFTTRCRSQSDHCIFLYQCWLNWICKPNAFLLCSLLLPLFPPTFQTLLPFLLGFLLKSGTWDSQTPHSSPAAPQARSACQLLGKVLSRKGCMMRRIESGPTWPTGKALPKTSPHGVEDIPLQISLPTFPIRNKEKEFPFNLWSVESPQGGKVWEIPPWFKAWL